MSRGQKLLKLALLCAAAGEVVKMHLALPQPCKHHFPARHRSQGFKFRRIHALRAQAPNQVEGEVVEALEARLDVTDGGSMDDSGEIPQDEISRVPVVELVTPGDWQQTLWRSFTLAGVGLHSGELSCVRVRPAFAGEGRYFVRVAPGTNAARFAVRQEKDKPVETELYPNPPTELDEEAEDDQVVEFLDYMRERDSSGFDGSFMDYVNMKFPPVENKEDIPSEAIRPRSEEEDYVIASIDNVNTSDHPYCTNLGQGKNMVQSVEHLLSALEACGVDNARIEIEGGPEVPVVDGSAFGWVQEVNEVGVSAAVCLINGKAVKIRRAALDIDEVLSVQDGSRSITLIPDDNMRISYGLDCEVPVIGKQWHTWCLQDFQEDYYTTIAPAKSFVPSLEHLYTMRDEGYVKGGFEGVLLVPQGNGWAQEDLIHFNNEAARHKIVDLIGDMSLLSLGGMSGLPYGHIIAHNADHDLHIKFVKALRDHVGEEYYEGYRADPTAPE